MAKKNTTVKMSKTAARAEGAAKTDRARKAALAEVRARIDDAAPPTGDVAPTAAPASGTPDAPTSDAGQQTPPSGKPRGKGGKKAKEPKPAKEPKAKRMSALDAAAQVLAKAAKPMSATELVEQMATQGLWSSPNGRTPSATLYAAMIREAAAKGSESRFKKVDRGMFEYAGK
ncbi:MAG: winged helix-turn-helix domain-containing protein [Gemmataceae bacterium]|nr:winged helix-turn-helix domain-containing protein [Gemmataceae bacterium]